MADLYRLAAEHRSRLIARDAAVGDELAQAYGRIWRDLQAQLDTLDADIRAAERRGEQITQSWLLKRRRLETLQRQAAEQLEQFAEFASERVREEQAAAVTAAQAEARALLQAAYADAPEAVRAAVAFDALPAGAVESLVGFASNGSPLRALFDGFGERASAAIRSDLTRGIAEGWNPKKTARRLQEHLGGDLVRAQRIARTETLRAYRESTRRTYEANADVVPRWRWTAPKQARTCAACLAMDGQEFPVSEPMQSHPNCRCTMTPVTPTWAELGFPDIPDTRRKRETGAEWLRRQPADVQRRVLGERGQAAFAAGEVELVDFVAERYSEEWGLTRSAASLKAARAAAARRA